jgi:hypothetical protein
MKLLLQAALKNSRHFTFAILTFISLLFATLANQCEMFSLGLMANTGADFFALFSPAEKIKDRIHFDDLLQRWDEIKGHGGGAITKHDAARYLAKRMQILFLGSCKKSRCIWIWSKIFLF